jgi:hypothetical protein
MKDKISLLTQLLFEEIRKNVNTIRKDWLFFRKKEKKKKEKRKIKNVYLNYKI